jgi:uncharacterized membrane protein SirB2
MNDYLMLRHLHLTFVIISILGFLARWVLAMNHSPLLAKRWVKVVPHINDTLLLAAALGLCVMLGQYPFVVHWLTAKVLLLIGYIVAGTFAIKRAKSSRGRLIAGLIALALFAQMIGVAITHSALGLWVYLV